MGRRRTDATYITNRPVWTHDSFRKVESAVVRQHLLDFLRHEFPVFGMHERHIFRCGRRLALWLETVNLEQFGTPILEAGSSECPAAQMREPLCFGKIEISLQPCLERVIHN